MTRAIRIRVLSCSSLFLLLIFFSISNLLLNSEQKLRYEFMRSQESNYRTSFVYSVIASPGVITEPKFGQGNQFFRYACAYALARALDVPLYLKVSDEIAENLLLHGLNYSQNSIPKSPSDRSFILDKFPNIPLNNLITPNTTIRNGTSILNFNDEFLLKFITEDRSTNISAYKTHLLAHGDYCQSEVFFMEYRNEIKHLFQPNLQFLSRPGLEWKAKIDSVQSEGNIPVGIHIRRGDFLKGEYWATPISFYISAIQLMKKQFPKNTLEFFVFSDNVSSIQDFLIDPATNKSFANLRFISGGVDINETTSSLDEFILMTLLSHLIISNSTFSWWAAYLIPSSTKVIIGPTFHEKFFQHYLDPKRREFKRKVIGKLWYPPQWIVLNPYKTYL